MEAHKFVKINTDELLNGTGVIIDLDVKTNKIVIYRDMKELTIFPYTDEQGD